MMLCDNPLCSLHCAITLRPVAPGEPEDWHFSHGFGLRLGGEHRAVQMGSLRLCLKCAQAVTM